MKRLIVTFVIATCAGPALAQGAANDFAERFTQMQVQSGAKFPNAPAYKSGRAITTESAAPAEKALAVEQRRSDFADRFAEMQLQSGARFVSAPMYSGAPMTALARKEGDEATRPR
jgi:predicted GIY-YIG superfamily endonuclease